MEMAVAAAARKMIKLRWQRCWLNDGSEEGDVNKFFCNLFLPVVAVNCSH